MQGHSRGVIGWYGAAVARLAALVQAADAQGRSLGAAAAGRDVAAAVEELLEGLSGLALRNR
jgi:hypothetical protein